MARTLTLTCVKRAGEAVLVDGGRPGHRALGVASGGPADPRARNAANRLLSQDAATPCLEFALAGGHWLLSGQGQFVLAGADMNWRLNGRLVEPYHVQYLDGDGLLTATSARRGARAYLAVYGQWGGDRVLGSLEGGLPGTETVDAGWSTTVITTGEAPFQLSLDVDQHFPPDIPTLRTVPGPEWGLLSPTQQHWLLTTEFTLTNDSNRQGLRLTGGTPPPSKLPPLLSSPVLPGTVQLTPDGPILLGPDAQTIGGYPRVLLVTALEDLAVAYQVAAGDGIRLK